MPQIEFIDRLWTFQLRAERGTQSALCRKPLVSAALGARRSCEQQRQVPATHPCLVQTVQKPVKIPQVQSSVPVEVPQVLSSIPRLWRRRWVSFSAFLRHFLDFVF